MSTTNGQTRSEEELRDMLHEAEERKQLWEEHFKSAKMDRKSNAEATASRHSTKWPRKDMRQSGVFVPRPFLGL